MLIVLDDLHDADETSLALLRFMARELKGTPIMIVATYRDQEVRRSPSLSKIIGGLSREARSIPVSGLSESEVTKLVEFTAGQIAGRDHWLRNSALQLMGIPCLSMESYVV